jgi:hypothetical protein
MTNDTDALSFTSYCSGLLDSNFGRYAHGTKPSLSEATHPFDCDQNSALFFAMLKETNVAPHGSILVCRVAAVRVPREQKGCGF